MTSSTTLAVLAAGAAALLLPPAQAVAVAVQSAGAAARNTVAEMPPTNEVTLETVAELPIRPSAAVRLRDGRIVWTEHFGAPNPNRVRVMTPGGGYADFFPPGTNLGSHSLRVDDEGILYGLDMGTETRPAVLWAWDPAANRLVHRIEIGEPAKQSQSSFGDFVVDTRNHQVLIGDTAGGTVPFRQDPAVVAVDLRTGTARRLLVGHPSVQAEPLDTFVNSEQMWLTTNRETGERIPSRWGVNGIALSPDKSWFYYAPMQGRTVYRIRTADLANRRLTAAQLGARVRRYGAREIGDGMIVDTAGNVYNTDTQRNAIGVTAADGSYRVLARDDQRLLFQEGFEEGFDGHLYVASNQAHLSTFFYPTDTGRPPYYIVRFRPLAPVRMAGAPR